MTIQRELLDNLLKKEQEETKGSCLAMLSLVETYLGVMGMRDQAKYIKDVADEVRQYVPRGLPK
jgi:hypothetical protein